jgi:predicted nucleic acid-binding protein
MRIFLDANIIVSVLNKEYPLFSNSSRILSLADHPRFQVYTSPTCLAIAYYFSEKKSGTQMARRKIELLAKKIKISDMNGHMVRQALSNPAIHDFEDGLEYYSALSGKCKCIITENTQDYYYSKIEVLNCEKFLNKFVFKK